MALIGIVSTLESSYGVSLAGQVTVAVHTLAAGHLWGIVSAAVESIWDSGRTSPASGTTRGRAPWIMA